MQYKTKWGTFIGSEADFKSFEAEMKRRENPVKAENKAETPPVQEKTAPAKAPAKVPAKAPTKPVRKTTK